MREGIVLQINEINAIVITPNGQFLSLPVKENWQIGETIHFSDIDIKRSHSPSKPKTNFSLRRKSIAFIAVMVASISTNSDEIYELWRIDMKLKSQNVSIAKVHDELTSNHTDVNIVNAMFYSLMIFSF